ncbi:SOS response-associated peptidase [Silvibacterium dinghuense]|uniref:Abasic site processing protein n=1 Tax=Silvibacterium dinghuense TaxID=1560006 RepID=A0A4Q1SHI3_9BACT|nr:SOS response-associated peptidase [Silvibacterium dinghuense]RXS96825.1 SOS response-associated peptidase [Silvibacterium dinghuense]GGG93953.1 hypothetical protein GCM10011586_05950 [Silvibacterium dinghuense]
MCGRYKRKSDKQRIAEMFAVDAGIEESEFEAGEDLRPQSMQPVVFTDERGARRMEVMRWGLAMPDRLLINARAEGIAGSRFWGESFAYGRAIVPGDAVFEWQSVAGGEGDPAPRGRKRPKYEITLKGQEPFGMAAVWRLWKNPKTAQMERSFAILTGEPNETVARIHDRMTTFLEPRDYDEYLATSQRSPVHLLRILPAERMQMRLVEEMPVAVLENQMNLF